MIFDNQCLDVVGCQTKPSLQSFGSDLEHSITFLRVDVKDLEHFKFKGHLKFKYDVTNNN
jgi:hypothetical protein